MSPIQQMLLGVGAVATKTYVDDVFSTFLYKGAGSTNTITNNIDLTEGGLVWVKRRDGSYKHGLYDTVRGVHKRLSSNANTAEVTDTAGITGFTATGFTTGDANDVNGNNDTYSSWSFRKSPMFDIVEYQGTGSAKTVAHSLGSIPGLILIKATDSSENWRVYHTSLTATHHLVLNTTNQAYTGAAHFNDTNPTASVFSVGTDDAVNQDGKNFVAYVFGGGESTNALARSVDFDGSDDYLSWAASSDFAFGTGAYTVEFWLKPDTLSAGANFFNVATDDGFVVVVGDSKVAINQYSVGDKVATSTAPTIGQWTHYALVREGTGSNQTKIYENGVLVKTGTDATDWSTTHATGLGANVANGTQEFDGRISNFRIVKGTAVYTSAFRPPTEPLTNKTNTKLLCCNNSSTTGSTVTPGTITANGDPTASTDSPFDDPAAHVFGKSGSESVIKCGSYKGNNSSTGPEIFLGNGWEPSFLIIKNSSGSGSWMIFDSMRGIATGGYDPSIKADDDGDEYASLDWLDLTSTGFKIKTDNAHVNDTTTYIYMAIRRPDGYVGKPPSLGTGVFNIVTGTSDSSVPGFVTNNLVDFYLYKSSTYEWGVGARLLSKRYWNANTNAATTSDSNATFDYNNGFGDWTSNLSGFYTWAWTRHAGFDVVTYTGDDVAGRQIPHSLNAVPEMMWVKNRGASEHWAVYHKGLNGGTNPEQYFIKLDENEAEYGSNNSMWNSTAPTSTHFTLGDWDEMNADSGNHIAMLFASVNGISKCGFYDADSNGVTVNCGFQPRFLIIKLANVAGDNDNWSNWAVFDSVRGFSSGNDAMLRIDTDAAEFTTSNMGEFTSTGFTLNHGFYTTNSTNISGTSGKYIYYAHA